MLESNFLVRTDLELFSYSEMLWRTGLRPLIPFTGPAVTVTAGPHTVQDKVSVVGILLIFYIRKLHRRGQLILIRP